MSRVQVIGIGNIDRGDDAAGRLVARRLKALNPMLNVIELDGEASTLVDRLGRLDAAYLVDACCSGRLPGSVSRFDIGQAALPAEMLGWSTHVMGVAQAVELARALGCLPAQCIMLAIEGQNFLPGAPVSAPVKAAADRLAATLAAEVLSSVTGDEDA